MTAYSGPLPAGFPKCKTCSLLQTATPAICASCVSSTVPTRNWRCSVCSRRLANGDDECGNPICGWPDRSFGKIFAIYPKTGAVDRVIKLLKYDGRMGWAMILGRLVLGWLQANIDHTEYDFIVANPTHSDRSVRHTEAVLEAADREDLADEWPLSPYGLVKAQPTSQSGGAGANWKTKWEAAKELESVVHPAYDGMYSGARVLVFDDVTTICGQMQILGLLLRSWGAVHVDGLVIARTGG